MSHAEKQIKDEFLSDDEDDKEKSDEEDNDSILIKLADYYNTTTDYILGRTSRLK